LLLLFSSQCLAQSYEDIKRGSPEAVETTLTANAFVFDAPTDDARPVGRLEKGKAVLAYNPEGIFYSIATEEKGFMGYVLVNKLDVEQDPNLVVTSPIANSQYKDPSRAQNLALAVPGGGQLYIDGRNKKGLAIFVGAVASFVGGYAISLNGTTRVCENPELQTNCRNETDQTGLIAGSIVAASFWAYGIFTAKGDAEKFNAANGLVKSAQVYPTVGRNGLGVAMKFTW